MTLIQVAGGVILGIGFWLYMVRFFGLPKWIRPSFSLRCQIDRIDLTAYRIKIGLEGFGK